MTPRRILFWFVLLPLTVAVRAQFLPPCTVGWAKIAKFLERLQPQQPELKPYKSMVICPFFGPCWRDGAPIKGAL